jgi:hypothetical protein
MLGSRPDKQEALGLEVSIIILVYSSATCVVVSTHVTLNYFTLVTVLNSF